MINEGGTQIARHQIVARQENHPEREVRRSIDTEAAPGGLAYENPGGQLRQNTAAVPSFGIGIDRAAMSKISYGLKGLDQHLAVLLARDLRDEPDATGVVLERRIIEGRSNICSMPSVHAVTSRHTHSEEDERDVHKTGQRPGIKRSACAGRPPCVTRALHRHSTTARVDAPRTLHSHHRL